MNHDGNPKSDNDKLKGKGERNTFLLCVYVTKMVVFESLWTYVAIALGAALVGYFSFARAERDIQAMTQLFALGLDPLIGFEIFIPPFVFIVISTFPYFNPGLRKKLSEPSRSNTSPRVQNMLNQFTFIVIWSLFLLIGAIALKVAKFPSGNARGMQPLGYGVSAFLLVLVGTAVIFEMLRSMRTIYILTLADYLVLDPELEGSDDAEAVAGGADPTNRN